MKKTLLSLAMVFLLITGAHAAEFVYEDQIQNQGAAFPINPSGGLSGAVQVQTQVAIGAATPGDVASNGQYQQNLITDGNTQGGPGNFTSHGVSLNQEQLSGGIASGGLYITSNEQQEITLIGSANAGPTQAISGSGILINQETGALAAGGAAAGSLSSMNGQYAYTQQASDANGVTTHFGLSTVSVQTESSAVGPGPTVDQDQTTIGQVGGSYTQNNGLGTSMQGTQAGIGGVVNQSDGSSGYVEQTHGYNQTVVNGGYSQTQTGVIYTRENL